MYRELWRENLFLAARSRVRETAGGRVTFSSPLQRSDKCPLWGMRTRSRGQG
jgi:hypothetical protein